MLENVEKFLKIHQGVLSYGVLLSLLLAMALIIHLALQLRSRSGYGMAAAGLIAGVVSGCFFLRLYPSVPVFVQDCFVLVCGVELMVGWLLYIFQIVREKREYVNDSWRYPKW